MIIRIIKGRKFTWYENKTGWEYEVKERENGWYTVLETEDSLWPLSICSEDIEIVCL